MLMFPEKKRVIGSDEVDEFRQFCPCPVAFYMGKVFTKRLVPKLAHPF